MLENIMDKKTYKEFKEKAENIDKLAQWAFTRNCRQITDKFSNIDTTIKILNNLVGDFVRKADKLEKNLITMTKLEQSEFQKSYYEKSIDECMRLSEKLKKEIQLRKKKVHECEEQVKKSKKELIFLKSHNIKLIMEIERAENSQHLQNSHKGVQPICRPEKEDRPRETGFVKNASCMAPCLIEENQRVQQQLSDTIKSAKETEESIEEMYTLMKDRLRKNETKSNGFGLAGSMLFKIASEENSKRMMMAPRKETQQLIYNVLKNKYNRIMKQKEKNKENLQVSLQEFLGYSPLQIVGVIELKGGLQEIMWKQDCLKERTVK